MTNSAKLAGLALIAAASVCFNGCAPRIPAEERYSTNLVIRGETYHVQEDGYGAVRIGREYTNKPAIRFSR